MDIKKIMMPDGRLRTYFKGDHQTWSEIVKNVILPDGYSYCESNWISSNHDSIWAPEKRVKAFLDRCAYLISLDNPVGLESAYKAMSHKVREIPSSECPSVVSDILYSDRVPAGEFNEDERFKMLCDRLDDIDPRKKKKQVRKPKVDTKFNRIARIRKMNPDAELVWISVDGDNCFQYKDLVYRIPSHYKGYICTEKLDSMDRILVVDANGELTFYDQNIRPMELQ